MKFALQKWGLMHYAIFNPQGRRLEPGTAEYYERGVVPESGAAS
jgi:hypothetical protein